MTAETTDPIARPVRQRLSRRVLDVPPSGIRKFFDVIATMPDVISLGIGEPDFTTPPQIIEEGVRSLRSGRTHYTSNFGTLELRRALSRNLERLYGVTYDPDGEILVTVGASEALAIAFAAIIDPGDEVILHEPSYVAYIPGITFAGGVPVLVPTRQEDDWALDPAKLEAAITPRTKALFLGYPCNPTGAVLGPEALRAIADIAARHDLLVISDEIYDRLVYGEHQHEAFSALPGMRERTILLGGFSKAYAMTGWRVGYACAPEGPHRGPAQGPPIPDHVGAHDRPGRGARGAHGRGAGCPADGQRVRPATPDVRGWPEPHRPADGRATRCLLRLPAHLRHRPHERPVQRAAAVRAPGRGRSRLGLRAVGGGVRAGEPGHELRAAGRGAGAHRAFRLPARVSAPTAAAPALRYEAVIGIECHVQLKTQSKMFCGCSTDFQEAPPNSHTCPVCLAMPGVLPVINRLAVRHVLAAGIAIGATTPEVTRWDRKNYFYPDLPKGYQISQYDLPLASGGSLTFDTSEGPVTIGITRAHLEEDTARLIHRVDEAGRQVSLVDFNRSGTALMEIVTDPVVRTAEQARRYAEELRLLLVTIGASDAAMESGQMRVEANVSLRPVGTEAFGTRVEVKNMNSFRSVERAIGFEIERQTRALRRG